jgi:nitrate/nitrite transporter NarK
MLRTIVGIVVGYLIFGVSAFVLFPLTHYDPHAPASPSFEVFAVVYGVFFAMAGGYLGTAISGKRALWVSFTIAAILAAGAISSLIAVGISWSPVSALICMVPAVVAGGWLRLRR